MATSGRTTVEISGKPSFWGGAAQPFSGAFFVFQAEDGIRDSSVTGVQTCALPISNGVDTSVFFPRDRRACRDKYGLAPDRLIVLSAGALVERKGHHRIIEALGAFSGEEIGRASCRERCRSRWSPYH